jgi:hypothetical protein
MDILQPSTTKVKTNSFSASNKSFSNNKSKNSFVCRESSNDKDLVVKSGIQLTFSPIIE